MKKPILMQMRGYEVVEKKADRGGNSGRVYVPKHWVGKKVRIVLIEPIKEVIKTGKKEK